MSTTELIVVAFAGLIGYLIVNALLSRGKDKAQEADKLLGVRPEASADEVRAAYLRLSARYAPEQLAALDEATRQHAREEARWLENAYREAMRKRGATP